ncbi:hypothetical protein FRB99_004125, partial [Tulasnella sp. 403]
PDLSTRIPTKGQIRRRCSTQSKSLPIPRRHYLLLPIRPLAWASCWRGTPTTPPRHLSRNTKKTSKGSLLPKRGMSSKYY